MEPLPARAEVEERLVALLSGRLTRDEVDRWAGKWVAAPDSPPVEDWPVWWALQRLYGIDLTHGGPDDEYLHDLTQIAEWLEDLRAGREPDGSE